MNSCCGIAYPPNPVLAASLEILVDTFPKNSDNSLAESRKLFGIITKIFVILN